MLNAYPEYIAPATAARETGMSLAELRRLAVETGIDISGPRGLLDPAAIEYSLELRES